MMKKKRKGDKTKTKLVDADEAAPITEDDCHILVGRSLLGSCQSFSFFLSLILFWFVLVFYPCSLDIIHSICFCLKDILFTYLTFILVFFFVLPALTFRLWPCQIDRSQNVSTGAVFSCDRDYDAFVIIPSNDTKCFSFFPRSPFPKKKKERTSEKTETHKNMLLYCSFIDVYSSRGLFQMMSPSELYILLCDKTKTRITS